MYCRTGNISQCIAEQGAYRSVLQNREYIGMYCTIGRLSGNIPEQAAFWNVLQNRQHIVMNRRTGNILEIIAK